MKVLKWLDQNIEKVFLLISTITLLIVLFLEVLLRFMSRIPGFTPDYAWTEEIAIFGLMWMSYWGASYATKNRADLKVEIVTTFLKPKAKIFASFLANFLMLVFDIFVLIYAGQYVGQVFGSGQTSAVLHITKWWVYLIAVCAFVVQIIRIIQDCIKLRQELKEIPAEA